MTANAPRDMIINGDCIDVMQAFDCVLPSAWQPAAWSR